MIKTMSVNCPISNHHVNNKFDNKKECLYKKCNYDCIIHANTSNKYDFSTYDLMIHNKEEYTYIYNKLNEAFKKYNLLNLEQLKLYFKELDNINNLYIVLDYLINNQILINNKIMIYNKSYYQLIDKLK